MNNGSFICYLYKKFMCLHCNVLLLAQIVRSCTYYMKLNDNSNYQGLLASARMNRKPKGGRASGGRLLTVVGLGNNFGIT